MSAVSAQWPSALPLWRRVAVVEALFTLHMLPLQALSLLVVTAPWTLPRMADIQLSQQVCDALCNVLCVDAHRLSCVCAFANHLRPFLAVTVRVCLTYIPLHAPHSQVAVLEGAEGRAALKRSTEVVRGRRWGVILPVVLCLVTARLLEGANRLLQVPNAAGAELALGGCVTRQSHWPVRSPVPPARVNPLNPAPAAKPRLRRRARRPRAPHRRPCGVPGGRVRAAARSRHAALRHLQSARGAGAGRRERIVNEFPTADRC